MNRKDFISAIIRQIDPFVVCDSVTDIIKTVLDFTHKNNLFLSQCTPIVDDGFLYINNVPVKRIAAKISKVKCDKKSYYYEGTILARQEVLS